MEIDKILDKSIWDNLPQAWLVVDEKTKVHGLNSVAKQWLGKAEPIILRDFFDETHHLFAMIDKVFKKKQAITTRQMKVETVHYQTEQNAQVHALYHAPYVVLCLDIEKVPYNLGSYFTNLHQNTLHVLASTLSHEIKNPLASIRGAAELLEPVIGNDDKNLTEIILNESDRILHLLEDMSLFMDEGGQNYVPLNIHEVLNYVTETMLNAEVKKDYDPSLPMVKGNREHLIQVFNNLLKNAAEATDKTVILSTRYQGGLSTELGAHLPLVVAITHHGEPVPEHLRDILFHPFVSSKNQAHNLKRGLGLAISKKIVQDHGGFIDYTSNAHETEFRVHFPIT